jgi:hypothetical protein
MGAGANADAYHCLELEFEQIDSDFVRTEKRWLSLYAGEHDLTPMVTFNMIDLQELFSPTSTLSYIS